MFLKRNLFSSIFLFSFSLSKQVPTVKFKCISGSTVKLAQINSTLIKLSEHCSWYTMHHVITGNQRLSSCKNRAYLQLVEHETYESCNRALNSWGATTSAEYLMIALMLFSVIWLMYFIISIALRIVGSVADDDWKGFLGGWDRNQANNWIRGPLNCLIGGGGRSWKVYTFDDCLDTMCLTWFNIVLCLVFPKI